MSKHTPGPFFGVYPALNLVKNEAYIEISNDSGLHPATEDDVALFTAAPEMLSLLKWTIETLEGNCPEGVSAKNIYGDHIRALIAKAEGKS